MLTCVIYFRLTSLCKSNHSLTKRELLRCVVTPSYYFLTYRKMFILKPDCQMTLNNCLKTRRVVHFRVYRNKTYRGLPYEVLRFGLDNFATRTWKPHSFSKILFEEKGIHFRGVSKYRPIFAQFVGVCHLETLE